MTYYIYFTDNNEYIYFEKENNSFPMTRFENASKFQLHSLLIDVTSNCKDIIQKLEELIKTNTKKKQVQKTFSELTSYSYLFNNFQDVLEKQDNKEAFIHSIIYNLKLLVDKVCMCSLIDVDVKYKKLDIQKQLAINTIQKKDENSVNSYLPSCLNTSVVYNKRNKELLSYSSFLGEVLKENIGNSWENVKKIVAGDNYQFLDVTCYSCKNLIEVFNVMFYYYKISKVKFYRCDNCEKFFIPANRHEKYCNRISPQDKTKTCKQYGIKETYKNNLNNDKIRSIHKKILQDYRNVINRHPYRSEEYEKKKEEYKEAYKENKNKMSEEDFYNWLLTQGVN